MKRAEFERLEAKRKRWRTVFQIVALIFFPVVVFCFCGPVTDIDIRSAFRAEARNECVNLVRAVKAYDMEYNRLPIPQGMEGRDSYQTETDEELMKVLLGMEKSPGALNPRGKVFYNGKDAKEGRRGLLIVDEGKGPRLVDPWGRPYIVVMDADGDHALTGPNGAKVHDDVICYSLGEDGVFDAKDPRTW